MAPPTSQLPPAHLPPDRIVLEGSAAGFVSRLIAFNIDVGLVVLMIVATSSLTQLVAIILPSWLLFTKVLPSLIAAIVAVIPPAYFFLSVAITGKTVGKGVMGLRIVRAGGGRLSPARSFVRALSYLVSLMLVGSGFLWVLIDRDRRGWHDMLAGSRVIYELRSTQL